MDTFAGWNHGMPTKLGFESLGQHGSGLGLPHGSQMRRGGPCSPSQLFDDLIALRSPTVRGWLMTESGVVMAATRAGLTGTRAPHS